MNIFKNLKYYFYISGVDLKKPPPDKRRFVKYSRKLLAIFFTTIMFVQIVWFILFEAERLQDCYESLFFGSSALICIIWWFLYQWNIQEFENLTDKLEAKVNERMLKFASTNLYLQANEVFEKGTLLGHHSVVRFVLPVQVFQGMLISFYMLFISGSVDSFPYISTSPAPFPFDCEQPFGYAMAMIIQYLLYFYSMMIATNILLYFLGIYMFLNALTEDIEFNFKRLNEEIDQPDVLEKDFYETFQLLIDTKQLARDFASIYSPVFCSSFCYSILNLSALLLALNITIETGDWAIILQLVFPLIVVIIWLFSFCCIGHEISSHLESINETIYQCNWYAFPIGIRRLYPTVLVAAQDPVTLNGFGTIQCSRETFKKIINSAFSYFMILRQFD